MRRIPPISSAHALITKQRVLVIILAPLLLFTVASIPSLSAQPVTKRQYVADSQLGLYSIDDTYINSNTTYNLSYPFLGEKTFDGAIAATIRQNKEQFMQSLAEVPHYAPSQLSIRYTTHFYNDTYLSLSLTSQQTIGDTTSTQETTFLYDRHDRQLVSLNDLFTSEKYTEVLAKSSHAALKKQLKKAYDRTIVEQYTQPKEEAFANFIINKKQQLQLVFQPNTVAPADQGIIKVTVGGAKLRDLTAKKIAKNLIKIPPKPQSKNATQETPPPVVVNLNPVPVPQADPSGVDCAAVQCIALTLDDGPKHETSQMLNILDANNAKATFFVLGMQAERYPNTIRRIHNSGHTIGNHTYDHQNLQQLSLTDARGQIARTGDILQDIIGVRPGIARAPFGAIDHGLAAAIGIPFIGWSVDPQDWMIRDAAHVCSTIVDRTYGGAIILAHDIHQSSVDGLRCAIPQLIQRGFVFVTVPQLLGFGAEAPPTIYSSR